MKAIKHLFLLILAILFLPSVSTAQDNSNLDYKPWDFNVNVGQTLFWGDLNNDILNPFSAYFKSDKSAFGYGLIVKKNFNSWLGVDFQYLGGQLGGTRYTWSNDDAANLYFSSKINHFGLNLNIDVLDLFREPQPTRLFNFYLRGGAGYNLYNATAYNLLDKSVVTTKKGGAMDVVGGWGIRLDVSKKIGITFENIFSYAFNDLLDAYSTSNSQANDMFAYTSIGASYRVFPQPPKKPSYSQPQKPSNAQDNSNLDYKPWSFNVNIGQTLFWGDLNNDILNPFSAYFRSDKSAFGYGFIAQKNFNSWLGVDFQYLGGQLGGTRYTWSNDDAANLYFSSKINHFGLNLNIDVLDLFREPQPTRLFNFYVRGGAGYILYDAAAYNLLDKSIVKTKKGGAVDVVGGWGIRLDVSKKIGITFENIFSYAFNDLLDAYSTSNSQANDMFAYTSVGATYRVFPQPKKPSFDKEQEIIPVDTTIAGGGETNKPAPELSVKVNLPSSMYTSDTVVVKLKIFKYDLNEKAKVQQTLPMGFKAIAKESSTAIYNFSDQIVSYNWEKFPSQKEFIELSYYIISNGVAPGNYSIPGIIFYDVDGDENINQFKKSITINKPKPAVVAVVEPKTTTPVEPKTTTPVEAKTTTPVYTKATGDLEYRVQVKAIYGGKSSPASIARQYTIDRAVTEEFTNGYSKYTAGSFNTYAEAKAYRDQLRAGKVPGAFVVAYHKGARMKNIGDAIKIEEKPSGNRTSEAPQGKIIQEGVSYSIQIAASTRDLSAQSLANQFGISDKVIKTTHNGLYKYMVGSYSSYDDAKAKLYEVRNSVSDAFIVKYINGIRK